MKNVKLVKYTEVENVPVRLLNRLLLEVGSEGSTRELVNHAIMKDTESQTLKKLKLKYKVNPKKRLSDEQLYNLALDYMEEDKFAKLYSVLMMKNRELVDETLELAFEKDNVSIEELSKDDIVKLFRYMDAVEFISYVRDKESMHKYIPAMIKSWIETENFKAYNIDDLYGFEYDKTLKEEFDMEIDFDYVPRAETVISIPFNNLIKGSEKPVHFGMDLIIEELKVLKSYMDNHGLEDGEKLKEYEESLNEKEKELTKLRKDLNRVEKALNKMKESNDSVMVDLADRDKQLESLKALLEERNLKIEEMKKAKKETSKSYNAIIKNLEKEKAAAEEKVGKIGELEAIIQEKDAELKLNKDQIECLKEVYEKLEVEYVKLVEELNKQEEFKQKEEKYIEKIEYLEKKLNEKETEMVNVVDNADDYDNTGYDLGDDLLDLLSNGPTF